MNLRRSVIYAKLAHRLTAAKGARPGAGFVDPDWTFCSQQDTLVMTIPVTSTAQSIGLLLRFTSLSFISRLMSCHAINQRKKNLCQWSAKAMHQPQQTISLALKRID